MVPMPSSVRSSIRMECLTLPSIMNTLRTPRRIASTQHSAFGIIPPQITPLRIRLGTSLTFTEGIRVVGSSFFLSSPYGISHGNKAFRTQLACYPGSRGVCVYVIHIAVGIAANR